LLDNPARAVESFLHPSVKLLPGHVQAVFIHNVLKVYGNIKDQDELRTFGKLLIDKLPMFTHSTHLEVQERACTALEILKIVEEHDFSPEIVEEIVALFEGELNPVAAKAQKKVPVPEDLDLDSWINDPLSDDEPDKQDFSFLPKASKDDLGFSPEEAISSEEEEIRETVSFFFFFRFVL
jgi:AP-3 complex subunit delta-1